MDAKLTPKVREALAEFHQYLSDAIAPLVAADSISLLLDCPPPLIAAEIQAWTAGQYRARGTEVPVSDYLYHAMRKLHHMGEFDLVPAGRLAALLQSLKAAILEYCPEEDRELLAVNLNNLGEAKAGSTPQVAVIHRQTDSEKLRSAGGAAAGAAELAHVDRRLSLLLSRLERQAPATQNDRAEIMSQVMAEAAGKARSATEFRQYKESLSKLGFDASMEEVFRSLGRSLPDWAVAQFATRPKQGAAVANEERAVAAMHRIIALEEDPDESAKRVHEMIRTAVEQFNAGSLPRAATMFELAQRVIAEKKVAPSILDGIQARAREELDSERLRKLAHDPLQHSLLRNVLEFFPALSPAVLLEELHGEQVRDRRRAIFELLLVHGKGSHRIFLERLERSSSDFGDSDWHFQRNLLHLLRRTREDAGNPGDAELDMVIRLSEPGKPEGLVREALANLGQMRHERAESALIRRMTEFENMLLKHSASPSPAPALLRLLDRAVSALARMGTPRAVRAVVAHGMKRQPQLGNTYARLADLGKHDLSGQKEMVDLLVRAVASELPRKVLGLVIHRDAQKILPLISALSGTRTEAVTEICEDIIDRFPDTEFAAAAAHAMEAPPDGAKAAKTPVGSLSGDLHVFGLPTLLQSLGCSLANGTLSITDQTGQLVGVLLMNEGRIHACRAGHLRNLDAFYQLFEKPVAGTFTFLAETEVPPTDEQDTMESVEILPVMLEGMRRYDEFRRTLALVPDDTILKPTGFKPSKCRDESDASLQRALWKKACSGASVTQCEAALQCDSYRIRKLLLYWVEEGALEPL